jgi:hypothetical protein
MQECDKCGNLTGKYAWYSYYNRFGVPTGVLFKYCEESKNQLISLHGIDESYFSKPADEIELNDTEKEYWSQEAERELVKGLKE